MSSTRRPGSLFSEDPEVLFWRFSHRNPGRNIEIFPQKTQCSFQKTLLSSLRKPWDIFSERPRCLFSEDPEDFSQKTWRYCLKKPGGVLIEVFPHKIWRYFHRRSGYFSIEVPEAFFQRTWEFPGFFHRTPGVVFTEKVEDFLYLNVYLTEDLKFFPLKWKKLLGLPREATLVFGSSKGIPPDLLCEYPQIRRPVYIFIADHDDLSQKS